MNTIIYGFIDKNNRLINTSVILDGDNETLERIKQESKAIAAYPMNPTKELMDPQTSYWNGTRFVWDSPYSSWIWDESTNDWEPPIPYPQDEKIYSWDEESLSWKEV